MILICRLQINLSELVNLQMKNLKITKIDCVFIGTYITITTKLICLCLFGCLSIHLSILKTMNSHQYFKLQFNTLGSF